MWKELKKQSSLCEQHSSTKLRVARYRLMQLTLEYQAQYMPICDAESEEVATAVFNRSFNKKKENAKRSGKPQSESEEMSMEYVQACATVVAP